LSLSERTSFTALQHCIPQDMFNIFL
jgi:hypothetical protein